MGLTTKQELFVSAYCSNGFNATQAAIEAGYSVDSAREIGSENLTKPDIAEAVDRYKLAIKKRHGITVESLLRELEEARGVALSAETPQSSAAIAATMGKAKLTGLDKHIVEVSGPEGSAIQIQELSRKDFKELLKRIEEKDDC